MLSGPAKFQQDLPASASQMRRGQAARRTSVTVADAARRTDSDGQAISDDEVKAANQRRAALRQSLRSAVVLKARFDRRSARVVLHLASGLQVAFLPADVQGLQAATPQDLATISISPSGLGLHFPALDADVYVPALLEGFLGSRRWMAEHRGRLGGRAATPAKGDAARRNGQLGGRPRKAVG